MNRIIGYGLFICLSGSSPLAFSQYTFQKLVSNTFITPWKNNAQRSLDGDITFATCVLDQFGTSGTDIMLVSLNDQGDTLWTKVYGRPYDDLILTLLATNDGGYLIVGAAAPDSGSSAYNDWLIKTNALGDTVWTRIYSGYLSLDAVECLGGGYLVVGWSGDVGLHMMRINDQGDLIWSRFYDRHDPPDYDSYISAWGVTQMTDSSFVVVGSRSYGGGFLSKFDPNGDVEWTKPLDAADDDYLQHIVSTFDGGLLLVGGINYGPNRDYLLIRLDSLLNTVWAKAYGTTADDAPISAIQTSNGGFAVTGGTYDPGGIHVSLLKTDSAGDLLFSRAFDHADSDYGQGIVETTDSGYVIVGRTAIAGMSSSTYLIKTDSAGMGDCYQDSVVTTITDVQLNWWNLALQSFPLTTAQNSGACAVGTGAALVPLCPLGMNEVDHDEGTILVYPNPAHDRFALSTSSDYSRSELEIFNALGDRVYHARIDQPEIIIARGSLPSGIYLIKVSTEHSSAYQKVVLE